MPLVFLAYLALVAGLALGAALPAGVVLGAVACAAVCACRRDPRNVGLALACAAGMLQTVAARRVDAACRARILRGGRTDAVLEADASPGARVTAAAHGCALALSLTVARGRADAGDVVTVRGTFAPTARGALVRDVSLARTGEHMTIVAMRARAGRTIDAIFGADAPLARALVVADAAAIPRDVRDRFADAGLVHLLSVSGLHVSLVAAALELLLGAMRLSRRTASVAAAVAVAGYVLLIGAPPPAVRAGTMLGAQLASRVLQRPSSPWTFLALGGAVPLLLDPRAVFDVGYQLSVAGMASLVGGRALFRRWIDGLTDPPRGARRTIARELAVSAVASAVTAPVVAWSFGRVSLVAPLSNLVAAPIVAALQPTLFLAVLLAPVRPLALHVAGAARLLLRALDAVARGAADVPHAALAVAPSLGTAVCSAGAGVALLAACAARSRWVRARAAIVAAASLALAAWSPLLAVSGSGEVELHMLDVGQGDAIAVRTPHGHWVLVDAGRVWRGGDAGRATVLPYLRRRGGPLDAFVLSHPHADHVGGAASVLAAMHPRRYLDAAFALGSDVYRASLEAARTSGVAWERVRPGEELRVDGVALRVLAPDSAWTASLDDPNLASVILSVRWRGVRFLLVGDAEAPEERWLVERAAADAALADALRADVLKVAHHGSRTSSTPEFLALVRPRVALVSVGAGNSYGLPNDDVLRRLALGGAEVLRTDRWGTIVVRTDGRAITVDAGGERWSVPPRSTTPDSSRGSSDP
ncbi:DNA internalization-related competence protein ComEC/Rec2 [Gemmatirosa kalamazoonensis]|uniref:DNA internalization-related competence protein ComEC/Rec2 n=1 Tax=Gemmatirosa kalamazoonensis TaxID=861299 RepID=UPI0011DE32D5|nr:DNA internalization-related competence protein ComEC/Rec2 [Gemmatirosa kalamazoonensis]